MAQTEAAARMSVRDELMQAGAWSAWLSLAEVVEGLMSPLSDCERAQFRRLLVTISSAQQLARNLPTTLDAHARTLIVTKLQESEHWTLELLRAASLERD
jgi:hypothetical protein